MDLGCNNASRALSFFLFFSFNSYTLWQKINKGRILCTKYDTSCDFITIFAIVNILCIFIVCIYVYFIVIHQFLFMHFHVSPIDVLRFTLSRSLSHVFSSPQAALLASSHVIMIFSYLCIPASQRFAHLCSNYCAIAID